jgi:hypothetical protein
VVSSSLPVHSVADLIRLAKERPLSYACPGTFHHLNAELISTAVGIKMIHLPYKGSAPALNALVAGHTQVMFTDLAPSLRLIRGGKLRALGITTAERAASAAEIPPLAEVGVPGYDAASWANADRAGEDAETDSDEAQRRGERHREHDRGQAAACQSRPQSDRKRPRINQVRSHRDLTPAFRTMCLACSSVYLSHKGRRAEA